MSGKSQSTLSLPTALAIHGTERMKSVKNLPTLKSSPHSGVNVLLLRIPLCRSQ